MSAIRRIACPHRRQASTSNPNARCDDPGVQIELVHPRPRPIEQALDPPPDGLEHAPDLLVGWRLGLVERRGPVASSVKTPSSTSACTFRLSAAPNRCTTPAAPLRPPTMPRVVSHRQLWV